jgi:hypothetical protein
VAWAVSALWVVAAACSAPASHGSLVTSTDAGDGGESDGDGGPTGTGPGDGDGGVPGDGGIPIDGRPLIDAPTDIPDAPPEVTDLAVLCGGHAPQSFDDWEDCYLKRTCEWRVGCVTGNSYSSVDDCIAFEDGLSGGELSAERRERQRAVEAHTASIDIDAFTTCLIQTSATRCNTALYDPACLTRYTGTVGDQASCLTDIDCASPGATCESSCTDACCEGTCQPKPTAGQACTGYGECAPGFPCNESLLCTVGDVGSPCNPNHVLDCDNDAWCDPSSRRCAPTFPEGAECTNLLQCGGNTSCVGTSITSAAPGHCVRDSQPGDPCDSWCHGNLYCSGGTCHSLPVLGQSCGALTPCAGANTVCDKGSCVMRSEVGHACSQDLPCKPGSFCTPALATVPPTCAVPQAAGATCNDPSQCDSHLCSGSATKSGVCQPWLDPCPS